MIFKINVHNCYKKPSMYLQPTIYFKIYTLFQSYIPSAAITNNQNHPSTVIHSKYKHFSDDTNRDRPSIKNFIDGTNKFV